MKSLILTLIILSLTSIEKAFPIPVESLLGGYITVEAGSDRFNQGMIDYSPPVLALAASVSPLNGSLSAVAASWDFSNTPDKAVWSGQQVFLNSGHVDSVLRLRVDESVNYSFTGDLYASLGEGSSASSFARIEVLNIAVDDNWRDFYRESNILSGVPFGSTHFGDGALFGASTGVLNPGSYYVTFASRAGGEAYGNFALTMTRSVPDTGSTLLLLGLALGVIGICRHKV